MPLTSHFTTMSLIAFRLQLLIFYFLSSGQFGYVNPESFNCCFRSTIGFLLLISLALRGYILSKVKLCYFLKCSKLSFQRQYKIFCSKNVISEYNTNGVIKSQGFNCNHHNMKIYSNTAHHHFFLNNSEEATSMAITCSNHRFGQIMWENLYVCNSHAQINFKLFNRKGKSHMNVPLTLSVQIALIRV